MVGGGGRVEREGLAAGLLLYISLLLFSLLLSEEVSITVCLFFVH